MTFGLVVLMFGSASGQQAKNIIKLKKTGNCKKCFLLKADLKKAKLKGAKLEGADLKFSDLKRANLSEADLSEADLSNANLSQANLSEAQFFECNLDGVIFKNANMTNTKINRTSFCGADLTEAQNIPVNELNLAFINRDTKLPEYLSITWISESNFKIEAQKEE